MALKKSIVQGFVMGFRNIVVDAFKYACCRVKFFCAGCLYVESMKADYQFSHLKILYYLPLGCWFKRYSEYCPNQADLKAHVP